MFCLVSRYFYNIVSVLSAFNIQIVHTRADNAGYYHNIAMILGLPTLSKATGVLIQSFNTSEPGYGKVFIVFIMLVTHNEIFF